MRAGGARYGGCNPIRFGFPGWAMCAACADAKSEISPADLIEQSDKQLYAAKAWL